MEYVDAFNEQERLIIEGFIDLMAKTPYEKITVKEIAARCSIARTAFYRSFQDTYDLMERIERYLLDELVLYRPHMSTDNALASSAPTGDPYGGIKHWFETGTRLRLLLKGVMGEHGDLYFKERLIKRLKDELNQMMDDELIPKDAPRPYYVAAIAAAYIGLLNHISVSEDDILPMDAVVEIANSMRVAYFKSGSNPPPITDKRLFGRE